MKLIARHIPLIALFLSSTGWGLTWLPAKILLEMGLASEHFILIAFGAGAIALLPFLWRQRRQWSSSAYQLLAVGLVGGFAYVAFQTAIARGDTVRVMILFYLLPIWSVIGGRLFLRERVDALRLCAVTICIGGAALTLDAGAGLSFSQFGWIDLLAVLSGLAFVGNNLLFRATPQLPLGSKVAAMYCGCALQMAVWLLLFAAPQVLPLNAAIPLAMLYGVVWITALTFCTQWAVTQMDVGRSAIIIVMELVAAVISTALLTAHELSPQEVIGSVLVLGAAILESARAAEPVEPAEINN